MRVHVLILLLLTPALVGCLSGDEGIGEQGLGDGTPIGEVPGRVARFSADGTELPIGEVPGQPTFRLTGHNGAEPSIGITSSGSIFLASGDEILRSQDEAGSWEVVHRIGLEGDEGLPTDTVVRSWDPYLWVDPITDRVYDDTMFPPLACTSMAWSDDDGDSWTERPAVCHPPAMDHQKFSTGPPGPDAPPIAGVAWPTVGYQCYNQLVQTICATTYNGGLDWVQHTISSSQITGPCGGINGVPAVGPEGHVAVPISSGCQAPTIAVSRDTGLSWTIRQVPTDTGYSSTDADIAFTPDGTLYLVYRDGENITHLARSSDVGESWEGPWRVAPPEVGVTVFHVISAGDDGKIAMAFLGSPNAERGPDAAPDEARWHLYIVTSLDAGSANPTFTSYQVTPDEDPVQVGSICMGGVGCSGGNRNLLDFIDSAVSPEGTFYVAYAEGCTDACANATDPAPEDSRDDATAIAWLEGVSLGAPAQVQFAQNSSQGWAAHDVVGQVLGGR